jgi:hypothetical protein
VSLDAIPHFVAGFSQKKALCFLKGFFYQSLPFKDTWPHLL